MILTENLRNILSSTERIYKVKIFRIVITIRYCNRLHLLGICNLYPKELSLNSEFISTVTTKLFIFLLANSIVVKGKN